LSATALLEMHRRVKHVLARVAVVPESPLRDLKSIERFFAGCNRWT
jgi:hypothetical protein